MPHVASIKDWNCGRRVYWPPPKGPMVATTFAANVVDCPSCPNWNVLVEPAKPPPELYAAIWNLQMFSRLNGSVVEGSISPSTPEYSTNSEAPGLTFTVSE